MERTKTLRKDNTTAALGLLVAILAGMLGLSVLLPQEAFASNATVWVVSKAKEVSADYGDDVLITTYAYDKKGVLKQSKETFGKLYESKVTYAYDKKQRLKYSKVVDGSDVEEVEKYTITFKRNGKGYVIGASRSSDGSTFKYKYNSKGLLASLCCGNSSKELFTYDGKKRLKTYTRYFDGELDMSAKVTYTKKGLLKTFSFGSGRDVYTTKNGRTKKKAMYYDGFKEGVVTYTYKKVSVPKSLVSMVKAQQTAIFIGNYPIEAAHR